ncbi:hypothetical protein VKT23_003643 [Stygiomarasmius scandens]|uniref:Uncharacterized protein n=1 Tax=Marasmiellus scandens TaxID=2682957 RepID=A0ABR1JZC5_9AGAR
MSMYGYYQNAEVCYAYLNYPNYVYGDYFDRGWTLQELVAPRSVVFFDKDWRRVGDKRELQNDIYRLAAIPPSVLSGEVSIPDTDVLDRMSWSVYRETTKDQDRAYCLQGLLGVSVEPDYDESLSSSFNRLGKALFDAHVELKERMEISDDLFNDPNSDSFQNLLWDRFWVAQDQSQTNCPTSRSQPKSDAEPRPGPWHPTKSITFHDTYQGVSWVDDLHSPPS